MPVIVLDKFDWHYNFNDFSNFIVSDSKSLTELAWSVYNSYVVDEIKTQKEFEKYELQYLKEVKSLISVDFKKSATEPRTKLYKYLQEHKGQWKCLESYFKTENSKEVIYLTSDIETLYSGRGWFNVTHTDKHTFVGIPDNGQLKMVTITSTLKVNNDNLSSFFG